MSENKFENINERLGLPRTYRFNQIIRWFVIILGILAMGSAIYFITTVVTSDSSTFQKISPFLILLLAFNTVSRNLFSLNAIRLYDNGVRFDYILKRSTHLAWNSIKKMEFYAKKGKFIKITYRKVDKDAVYYMPISIPNMLEIINSMAQLCPKDVEFDDFLKNVIVSE